MTRPTRARTRMFLTALCGMLALSSPGAQERIEGIVEGSDFSRIKIAVPPTQAAARHTEPAIDVVETIRADLRFSGYFDVIDPKLYRLVPEGDRSDPRHEDWLSIGADALLRLRLNIDGNRVDVQARLFDNASETLLFARRYGGTIELLRRVAHNVSDDLVRHYSGRTGVAMTRLAFVSQHGDGKEIYLMDYDGRNIRRLTTTGILNLSPVWSPPGDELAFVSWRGKQPAVYVMSSDGRLGHLATVGGELSAAPEWSPDGRRLVYSSDIEGNTELYLLDRASGRNTRLTRHPGIDTAPAFAPNGREIAFTSDRTGSPQIYIMSTEGLDVRRVSWGSSYNDAAAWSPDGATGPPD